MWKDISKTYALKNESAISFIWVFDAQKVSIRLINLYKDEWSITCFINNNLFSSTKISFPTLEQAQNYALSYVRSELAEILESLPS